MDATSYHRANGAQRAAQGAERRSHRAKRLRALRRPDDSLRARLTLAFAAIILVTLFLAGSAFVFILRDYQIRRETTRVADLTLPLSQQVRSLEQLGASTQEIVDYLERQSDDLDLRIVLADARGVVFADTQDTLVGHRLEIEGPPRFGIQRRVRQATVDSLEGDLTFMVSPNINPQAPSGTPPPPGASVPERFLGRPSAYLVGLSVEPHSWASAWLELLPRLSQAALAALLLSIAFAWPLAASIARPLGRMTEAAEAMAEGQLDQRIPAHGRDEVARLAQAFNTMARAVSASQQTLRDFLANVSHDLRTPLTSIRGFSQALTDGLVRDPAHLAETGRIINQEAARMSSLVEDLLLLSKLDSGQAPLERQELALRPLLGERVEAAGWRATAAGVELRYLPEADPLVSADRAQLDRVIANLLDNAFRHVSAGGVVTVRLRQPAEAVISVHNTGSYLPPDELTRVFERFYQVDRARATGSSGLGLAIASEIVRAHGGRCWAESSPQGGTGFFVALPAVQTSRSARPKVPQPAGSSTI